MEIVIQNKNGRLEIGGGRHPIAKLIEIAGLGLPTSEPNAIKYAGQPGYKMLGRVDMERTITMSLDFHGIPFDVMKIYRVLQEECELLFFLGGERRKIKGFCLNSSEAENIIYKRMYKIVLQFVCENPYFEDFSDKVINLSTRTDLFPTSFEGGLGYITLPAVATERTATITVNNRGDIDAYPTIIVVAGEDSDTLTISNLTTDKSITINKDIVNGEKIVFDIGNRIIKSDLAGSLLNYISDDTIMSEFVLRRGVNELVATNGSFNLLTGSVAYKNQYKAVVLA
ncbi:MAG: phage tail family protein [Clostridia bacterium]|nr:phage tail family protein [Clostridia bacterium]